MPIYEFYCNHCNTIFNFYSRRVNTAKIPSCPRCNRELQRMLSAFNTIRGLSEELIPNLDESRLESALTTLVREAESIDENDPRQAARLMRKLSDMTGINFGEKWEEALERMEAGEDPEEIEKQLGDIIDEEEPFIIQQKRFKKKVPPKRDETLYEL